jgi:hypothetical protein
MKVIQIVPQEGLALYAALVKKEAELRKKNRGTFYRTAGKKRNSSKWRHRAYPGWLNLERGLSEVVLAESIHPRLTKSGSCCRLSLDSSTVILASGYWPSPSITAEPPAMHFC